MEKSKSEKFIWELEMEAEATRRCLEKIPEDLFDWKPHEKSMSMGNLANLISDIPNWIADMVENLEIDLAAYRPSPKSSSDFVSIFDENLKRAKQALEKISDKNLAGTFDLKMKDKVLMSSPLDESIASTINHMVHHRGQLTVYMRLKDIPVPSIYGPSADARIWG